MMGMLVGRTRVVAAVAALVLLGVAGLAQMRFREPRISEEGMSSFPKNAEFYFIRVEYRDLFDMAR